LSEQVVLGLEEGKRGERVGRGMSFSLPASSPFPREEGKKRKGREGREKIVRSVFIYLLA